MRSTVKPAPPSRLSSMPRAPPSAGVTERQRTRSRAMVTGSAGWRMGLSEDVGGGGAGERIGAEAVGALGAAAKPELDDQHDGQQRERDQDDVVDRIGAVELAIQEREQVERDV